MASIPQFYCDEYTWVAAPPTTAACVGTGGPFWEEESNLEVGLMDDFGVVIHDHQPTTQYSSAQPIINDPPTTSFPQQHMLPFPQLNAAVHGGGSQNLRHLGYQPDIHQFYEFPDDSFGLVPEIKPVLYHPLPPHNWVYPLYLSPFHNIILNFTFNSLIFYPIYTFSFSFHIAKSKQ